MVKVSTIQALQAKAGIPISATKNSPTQSYISTIAPGTILANPRNTVPLATPLAQPISSPVNYNNKDMATAASLQNYGKTSQEQWDALQKIAQNEQLISGSVSPTTQAHIDVLNPANANYFNQTATTSPWATAQNARDAQALGANDLTGAGGKGLTGSALIAKQLTDLPAQRDAQLAAINAAGGDGFNVSQQFAQQEADLKAKLAQQQVTDAANQQADLKGHLGTTQGAAPNAITPVNGNRFQGAGDASPDRQSFITAQRAQGKTDAQIRQMINTLPPEQTGGVPAGTQSTTTPAPTVPPASSTNGAGTTPASTTTPSASGATTPPAGTDKAGTQPVQPQINPQANVLRQLAATETDPLMKISLNASADQLDAIGVQQNPMGQAAFNQSADAAAIAQPYNAIQAIQDNARVFAKNMDASNKAFMTAQLDRTDKYNASQQENINNQLQFQNDKAVRDQADANKQQIDHMTIMLALEGGFGSNDGNNEIATARQKGEQAIQDLNKQYGFKMTDVSLQFTQMHNDAHDNYQQNWLKATDDFETKVNNLDLQGISNQGAKASAISTAYKSYVSDIKTARIDYAKTITDATKMVQDAHNAVRDDQRAQENVVRSQAQWAVSTYGSGAKPFIEKLAKDNPNVDLAGLMGGQTLAEQNQNFDNQMALMKEGRIGGVGGGGGGLAFASHLTQGTGQPPSFESFLNDKEKSSLLNGSVKFDTSPAAMADYRKEYDAKLSVANQHNPSDILNSFEQRAAAQNLSGPVYKRTSAIVQDYLNKGQYQQASDIVSNIGDDIPSAESVMFQQGLNARFDVNRLHDAMQNLGTFGPITGRVKNLDPYNPEAVRVKNLITQTVPNLARGIFREVGVLTDTDVARYTKTLENPELTLQEAQNAYNDLTNKVNVSMQNQLSVWDAENKRTKGLKQLFAAPIPNSGISSSGQSTGQSTSADEAFANSILSGK